MSDIQLYLLEVDKNRAEARQIARNSATKLESKELKLIDLITSLEEYINNKDDAGLRAKSVYYLAEVLESVPLKVLTGQERRLLCDFILGRLKGDVEGIGSSARALLALEERGKWDPDTAQKVMKTFVDHTYPLRQFKLQTERYPVVQLIDMMLAKYRNAIKQMHETDRRFMDGFVSYFEGEKDPRNLMIVFSLLRVPMAEWEIQGHAQDMFEAVFNYFPITFKPPPDDPYAITAQDLKDRLRACISANSDFAPYSVPALLDKLDSTSMNTKRDVLQTFQACISNYGAQTINLYSVTLWDALKFEVLNVQEEDLADETLKTLAQIAAKFTDETAEGPLLAYLRPIIKECNEHLEDAPTKQSHAAGRILYSVSRVGPIVAEKIVKGVLPTLFELYQASNSIAKRRGLLDVFNQVVKAYHESQVLDKKSDAESLQSFAEDGLSSMLQIIAKAPKAEVSFRLAALSGMAQLVKVQTLLSGSQVNRVVDAITDLVLHERVEGHGDIRAEAIRALIEIAGSASEVVRTRAIPAFMVELPDVSDDKSQFGPMLEAFAQLSSEHQVFDTVALRIKNKLSAARYQNAPKQYYRALLLALLYAFTFGSPLHEDGAIRNTYFAEYAEPLMKQLRDALPSERDDASTEVIGRIVNIILRPQTPHFQITVYNENINWLSPAADATQATSDHTRTFAPFSLYYYAALRPDIVESTDIVLLLRHQSKCLLESSQDATTTVLSRHLSLLVNKFLNPKSMEPLLTDSGIDMQKLIRTDGTSRETGAAFAILKGLVIQGKSSSLTSKYLQLFLETIPTADKSFAKHFSTILAPDDILTKDNHCVISGLYKQKAFTQIVHPIVESLRTAATEAKPKYLIALAGILKWLPYSVVESSLSSLVSPLLQSLDLNNRSEQEVKSSALTIFESMLMHNPSVALEHTASLITRLLNATSIADNAATVRVKALQCLTLVPKQLKTEAVVPYRRPVVKNLLGCLDDPKRNVRAEAVRCRTAWLALEEAGEDEE